MTPAELFATAEYKQNEYFLERAVWCKTRLGFLVESARHPDVRRMFELELAAAIGEFHGYNFRDDELYIDACDSERARKRRGL